MLGSLIEKLARPLPIAGLLVALAAPLAPVHAASTLTSYAIVHDDGTMTVRKRRIRLHGIHIPRTPRSCRRFTVPTRCGSRAANALDFKIHGFVEAGTIKEEIVGQKTKRTFILQYEGKRILVKNEGPKPDTFRDLAEVVAKGRLVQDNGEYVLEANELMAKCPSKYEENQRTKDYAAPPPTAASNTPPAEVPVSQ